MKVYIAGPMTGLPQFNVPLFDYVAAALRERGYDVVSPAELDSPEMRKAALESRTGDYEELKRATGETWGHVLSRDVKVLSDQGVQGIVLLRDWYKSRGATMEATVGLLNNLHFFVYTHEDLLPVPVSHTSVLNWIHEGFRYRWRKST